MQTIGNDPTGKTEILADLAVIDADTSKIDDAATNGLTGTPDALAYRVGEVDRHLHNHEKWFGIAAVASGETHVADRMAGGIAPFVLTAGADNFGVWIQIFGSSDSPVAPGAVKFDSHRFMITDTNSTNPFIVQVICCESADIAAKLLIEDFTEFPYVSATNNNDSGISDVLDRRENSGTKVWARCCCIGSSGSTMNLYHGLHEYEG